MEKTAVAVALVLAAAVAWWLAANPESPVIVDVALGKPVTADSVYDDRYPPANAVDGNRTDIASRWLSSRTESLDWNGSPHWIEIDLGGEHLIRELRFWSGAHGEYKWQPVDFRFQRHSGDDWFDVVVETGNLRPDYAAAFDPVPADRVRLVATRGSDPGALRLYEVEVYGTAR